MSQTMESTPAPTGDVARLLRPAVLRFDGPPSHLRHADRARESRPDGVRPRTHRIVSAIR